ncbi:hypothetical protein [Nocardiopsis suaedae]|uniref:Uncharacterized protein n=1 Tax=Nocardiopsis suaedae TaxID=3018444 RepID=A0ABT4TVG5_9ACTN|nr:hypothetical protein [Nocardiopsis suaedae]MDA2808234.1 hypothetical protein [Nocardiopsis suaedae]
MAPIAPASVPTTGVCALVGTALLAGCGLFAAFSGRPDLAVLALLSFLVLFGSQGRITRVVVGAATVLVAAVLMHYFEQTNYALLVLAGAAVLDRLRLGAARQTQAQEDGGT